MSRDLAALNAAKQASDSKRAAKAKENQQAAIAEERETLQGMTFPAGMISESFRHYLIRVLRCKTVVTADCDWPMLKSLLNDDPVNFNLHQMAKALNTIEATSMKDLDVSIGEYIDVQDKIAEMAAEWNAIVGPIRESIREKYK